jgi:hypothetical protein
MPYDTRVLLNIYGIAIVRWQNKPSQNSLLYTYNLTTHRKPSSNKNYKYVYGLLGYAAKWFCK